ncbi:MAG: disulfide bond formation protein B [Caulobacteraceae bacterium]
MRSLSKTLLDLWPLAGACASAAMLAAAHAFETFGGLAPCHLCFYQRDVYWAALSVGVVGFALGYMRLAWVRRAADGLLALIFLAGMGLAAYHAGVEWTWWPGPASCTGGGAVNAGQLAAFMNGAKLNVPQCDQAAWRMFGISMAGYNAVISLGLTVLSVLAVRRERDHG